MKQSRHLHPGCLVAALSGRRPRKTSRTMDPGEPIRHLAQFVCQES
jgi:hypothetical protein